MAEQRPQRRGGDLYAVVVVGVVLGGNLQQAVFEVADFVVLLLLGFQGLFFIAAAIGAFGAQFVQAAGQVFEFGVQEVVDGGVEGLVAEGGVIQPQGVVAGEGLSGILCEAGLNTV